MITMLPDSLDCMEPVETPLLVRDSAGHLYNPKGYRVPQDSLTSNLVRPHPLWSMLLQRVADKGHERILVPELEDHPTTEEMVSKIPMAWLGDNTIYATRRGKPSVRYHPPSKGAVTKGELAREYIHACAEQTGKLTRNPKRFDEYLDWPAPLYYEPGPIDGRWRGEFAYVDLSSAYWTIHKTASLVMAFKPRSFCLTSDFEYYDTDEVTEARELRHAIPGSFGRLEPQMLRYGNPVEAKKIAGPLCQRGLVGYTMYTMNCIAREMIDHFGVMMVMTDGYILPLKYADLACEFLLDRWGMKSIVKGSGDSALYGVNVYQVGNKKSNHAPDQWTDDAEWLYKGRPFKPLCEPVNRIMDVDTQWMHEARLSVLERGLGRKSLV